MFCGIVTNMSAWLSIALSDGSSNVPVSRVMVDRMGSNSVISQASKCLRVRWGCLFEQGDWTLHWPSGMIRPTLICCYTDPHMQKKRSLSHHPMSSLDQEAVSIERETRPPWPAAWKHILISPKYKQTQKPSLRDKRTHSHLQKYVHAWVCINSRQTIEHTL